ncbi:hypothetical protein CspeluHIS016_0103620 [Cutaneotrichosporon spelunceum]|uniref:F-box domain-containing protein n=1 Tax=Cutaneotrichosporon spelunceum TaxID=1672016 RepID=A0AAD3TNW2_9TREE|nr:hypothetical protein CspeluHIS016_0103620 [Cutaneotrichosporon spelunceum]
MTPIRALDLPAENVQPDTTAPPPHTSLLDLPDELLLRILAELPAKAGELTTTARVCKRLHGIAHEQLLWAQLFHAAGFRLAPEYARRAVAITTPPGTWEDGGYIPAAPERPSLLSPAKLLAYVYDLLWPADLPQPGTNQDMEDAVPIHYPTLFRARCAIADEMKARGPHHVYTKPVADVGNDQDDDAPLAQAEDMLVAPNHLWMITEHTAKVYTVRVHGSWVISGSRDQTVKLWRLPAIPCDGTKITLGPSLVASAEGHDGSVLALDFELADATTGKGFMVTGSSDMTAKVWEIDWGSREDGAGTSARVVCELRGATDRVAAVAFTDELVITGSHDHQLRIYDREKVYTNDSVSPLRTVEVGPVCGISLNSRGLPRAAVGTTEGRWAIIDLTTGERLLRGGEGEDGYGCIVWEDDYILTGAEGGKTILYSGLYAHRMRTYRGPKKRLIRAAHLDLANNTVLSAGHDGHIHFTDLDSWEHYRSYELGGGPIFGMDVDGLNLVFGTGEGAVGFVLYGSGLPYAGMFV